MNHNSVITWLTQMRSIIRRAHGRVWVGVLIAKLLILSSRSKALRIKNSERRGVVLNILDNSQIYYLTIELVLQNPVLCAKLRNAVLLPNSVVELKRPRAT